MGIIHDRLNPGVDGFDKFANFFPDFLRDNYHDILRNFGVIPDLRNIITGYWLPSTNLNEIKQNLDQWKEDVADLWSSEFKWPLGVGWSEAFAPFLIRFDVPFITPTQIPAIEQDIDFHPLPDQNTLTVYADYFQYDYTLQPTEENLRLWAARSAFRFTNKDEHNRLWMMKNLTHVNVSPLPIHPTIISKPTSTVKYALRLAAPTMDAKTWNTWFDFFVERTNHSNKKEKRSNEDVDDEANFHHLLLDASFFMLHLDLKCPLNELIPLKLFSAHQGKIKFWCGYLHQKSLPIVSFTEFETSVKALQARVDIVNDALSIGKRKRKAEKQ